MLKIPIADIIKRIHEETGISELSIKEQIDAKVAALNGLVSEEGAAFIVASEMGVQLLKTPEKNQEWKIKDLVEGAKVDVSGYVARVFKTFPYLYKGQAKEMGSFILKDDTGEIRVALWDDKVNLLKENKLAGHVKIKNAQVKVNKLGAKELHVGNKSIVLVTDEISSVPVSRVFARKESKISEIKAGDSVSVLATVVKIFPIKAYSVCSKCGKKVVPAPEGFLCAEHKVVMPENRFMLGFYLDDGTGVLKAIAFGNAVEKLTEVTKTQITLTPDFAELLEANLLGRVIFVEGRARENKNFARVELLVDDININPNPREIAQRLAG